MKKTMSGSIALLLLLTLQLAWTSTARAQGVDSNRENKGKPMTIYGYARDVACLMRHPDALKPNECALQCAKGGSPTFIVTKDDALYLPISDALPDTSQQAALMPFVGKYARANGTVFERAGLKAIEIHDIHILNEPK